MAPRQNKAYINYVRREIKKEVETIQENFTTSIFETTIIYKQENKVYIILNENEKFTQKFNENFYQNLVKKIVSLIRSKIIKDRKFQSKEIYSFKKKNTNVILYTC